MNEDKLRVLLVAAEAVPFSKVGGLAEFAGALPKALHELGVDVRLMLPRYGDRDNTSPNVLRRVGGSIPVPAGSRQEPAHLLETTVDDIPVYLIYNDQFFGNRERVYGFNDDPQRFVFFSRAVVAALSALDWSPCVVHANDWHTAAVPTWLSVYGARQRPFADMASLFTIHNFAYQGISGRLILDFAQMTEVPHLEVEPPGKINWMAQGIAHADLISTVSSTYAQEILTPEIGGDLQPLLQERSHRLFGILSGIDTKLWNPDTDSALTQTYDAETLNMRTVNKTALQRELRLPVDMDVPLIGVVTRLDPMKGLSLLAEAVEELLRERDVQLVLLGSGDEDIADRFHALQTRYPRSVRALIRFDERTARRLYGSVDLFAMPSRHEAVSVGLMTAMRYGAVPVVRQTGGLADTVTDADVRPDHGNGFSFPEYETNALVRTLKRALNAYDDEARWVEIQRRAMAWDFSWHSSAQAYVDLYNRALMLHRGA
ncbi:MAG: glycogen synthase [Anaerolineae bacterium]